MSCYDHKGKNCVCEVVRFIKDLQDNAVDNCRDCETSCFLEPLGDLGKGRVGGARDRNNPNTRVFVLYNKEGELFKALVDNHCDGYEKSKYFRVEDVFDGCCATLRVLEKVSKCEDNEESGRGREKFVSTDTCITVDLACFCAIQCIADVFLPDVCN
ncbi:CotY/CotZ family spore coat protein [Mangrovibacillus cuniculi]|uniref:Spore coat protein CotZ n=1 Tax=Mangrovibacillus cuniculi TaxID=2593652 RepID=A0A7S8C9X3_9BACI|nr:CotY/CotZ family spore coat protein [Mangrovibacillus cuniculi]QPC46095.1 spore coat protein CotZ [Mangrovibacillus cuniculi]